MSLATCRDNKPWVCEVHYVFDDNLNLYFRSKEIRRHSIEIAGNPFVAGDIVEQHSVDQVPRGVYFEGKAEILNNIDEKHQVYKLFCDRFDLDEEIIEDAKSENGHRFYKISVDKYYLFDSRESNPSQKYELNWSR